RPGQPFSNVSSASTRQTVSGLQRTMDGETAGDRGVLGKVSPSGPPMPLRSFSSDEKRAAPPGQRQDGPCRPRGAILRGGCLTIAVLMWREAGRPSTVREGGTEAAGPSA